MNASHPAHLANPITTGIVHNSVQTSNDVPVEEPAPLEGKLILSGLFVGAFIIVFIILRFFDKGDKND